MNLNKIYVYIVGFLLFNTAHITLADKVHTRQNKHPLTYLMDNLVIDVMFWGGYYTVGFFATLLFLCVFKRMRVVIFGFFIALFFLFLCMFVIEAVIDFRLLPIEKY